eukprot:6381292-Lingulodinium_polyedra.AAC.1
MYRSGSATTSPGRGTPRMAATPTCTCRRSARAAGGGAFESPPGCIVAEFGCRRPYWRAYGSWRGPRCR